MWGASPLTVRLLGKISLALQKTSKLLRVMDLKEDPLASNEDVWRTLMF